MPGDKTLRICKNGHQFYKSTDCATCPVCEKQKEPVTGFLSLLSNPARNTLINQGIDSIEKLSTFTEKEILSLHGMGKASIPALLKSLSAGGLSFKKEHKSDKSTKSISKETRY